MKNPDGTDYLSSLLIKNWKGTIGQPLLFSLRSNNQIVRPKSLEFTLAKSLRILVKSHGYGSIRDNFFLEQRPKPLHSHIFRRHAKKRLAAFPHEFILVRIVFPAVG